MSHEKAAPQQEPHTQSFEFEQSDVYGKYMLHSRAEILFILRSMVKKNCMASIYFDHGKSFFLTALVEVDDRSGTFVIDRGSDEEVNQKALKADRLLCTASLDKVKIQFSIDGIKALQQGGDTLFVARLPKSVLRLQRREYFRLDTPQGNPIVCSLKLSRPEGGSLAMSLPLLDISGGGVGLLAGVDVEHLFPVETELKASRIDIPGEGVVQTDLLVRNAFRITMRNGSEHLRIGCEYVDLPANRLTMIQRYITKIERERKARLSGLD